MTGLNEVLEHRPTHIAKSHEANSRHLGSPHHKIISLEVRLLAAVHRNFSRKGKVGRSWYVDDTYNGVRSCWRYLYRAIDRDGALVDAAHGVALGLWRNHEYVDTGRGVSRLKWTFSPWAKAKAVPGFMLACSFCRDRLPCSSPGVRTITSSALWGLCRVHYLKAGGFSLRNSY
jgi:hypothetical protein